MLSGGTSGGGRGRTPYVASDNASTTRAVSRGKSRGKSHTDVYPLNRPERAPCQLLVAIVVHVHLVRLKRRKNHSSSAVHLLSICFLEAPGCFLEALALAPEATGATEHDLLIPKQCQTALLQAQ
jgi:hypothetical protein